ncbi:MAG: RNA polymerase sigma factor [Pseudomonadota bacterium]
MNGQKNFEPEVREAIHDNLRSIWRFGYALSGSADTADDLAQATFLRALEKSHQVTSTERLGGWFLTICRSIWLNELRSRTLRRAQSLDTTPEASLPTEKSDTETNIFAREVLSEVMALPEAQRVAVVLVFVEGHSYRDAAKILEVPMGTVMSRLHGARGKLRHLSQVDTEHELQKEHGRV